MIKRYPHTATIKNNTETDSETIFSTVNETTIEIKGRYEPSLQKNRVDFSGKFYCDILDVSQFSLDGKILIFEGKQFKIVQLHNYQKHCEIWLE